MSVRTLVRLTSLLLTLVLSACDQKVHKTAEADKQATLTVVTRNAPTTYYLNRENEAEGPEHDLLTAFARREGLEIQFLVVETISELLNTLEQGRADVAAAGLSVVDERKSRLIFSRPYRNVRQQLVCRRGGAKARSLAELSKVELEVAANSSYEHQLQQLQARYPKLKWVSNQQDDTEHLLYRVWEKQIDCTIADSNIIAVNRRFMPELLVMLNVGDGDQLAWALNADNPALKQKLDAWLTSKPGVQALRDVEKRYYSYIDTFDFVDTRALVRRIDERLPKYQSLFEKAARQYHLPATLLMAQSYQESHWNPKAASSTGVKGIMMLTRNTASSLGVKNRLDPTQAIPAGAAYLAKMKERFRVEIPEPDRTYLALAAYNIGRAHMHDAQTLARKLGKNPDNWSEMESVLPLLSQKQHYKNLKYGYARGLEPVRYVQRIRNYQSIIEQKLQEKR